MADDLSSYLMHDHRHAKISPEELELMGKQAANLFLNDGISLNEGVAKLASAHDDITQEQVKRVCEFANTAVYLAKHDQSKTAGDPSSYPQFDLADPNRVIQDLSDGARPTVITPVDADYSRQPLKKEKLSSVSPDAALEMLFGVKEASSEALADFSPETAVNEVMSAKDSLVGLKQHLEYHAEQFDMAHKEAQAQYYDLVKRHLLDDGSFVDVMAAARSAVDQDEKIASVVQPVVVRLLREKVASPESLKAGVTSLTKVAHRVVNEQHPLVTTFRSVSALADEVTKVATALEEVSQELDTVNAFIKEHYLAGSSH